jgi:hypothetical protein
VPVTALESKDAASTFGMALASQWKAVLSFAASSLHDVTLNCVDASTLHDKADDRGLIYTLTCFSLYSTDYNLAGNSDIDLPMVIFISV